MKKFSLFAILIVLSLVLAACGGGGGAAQPTAAPAKAAEPTAAPEPTQAPEPSATTAAAEPTAAPTEAPAAEAATEAPAAAAGEWTCPQGDQTVTIWHGWTGDYFTNIENIFKEYMKVCPNIKVELVNKTDLSNALTAAVPAGEGPDVFAWVNDQIGRMAEAQIIVPLTPYIDKDAFAKTYIPTAVEAVTYNGDIWAYPESMEAITMIYNKDLIKEDQLPKTTDDLLNMAKDWKGSDYLFVYNAKNDAYFSAPWWQAAGVTIIDEQGNTTFKSDAGYAAGDFIKGLKDNKVMPEEIDYGIADTLFKEGKAAIIMNGPWYIQDLDKAGMNYGLALLPVFSKSGTPGMPFVGVKTLSLTKNAVDHKTAEAAVNVMQYYTSAASQVALAQSNKMVPTNAEAVNNADVKAIPVIASFGAQAANGKPMPNTPYMGAMWDPMAKGVECIWTGGGTVQECVDKIQTMAEENIAGMK
jgi:arabinogalactan oligomer / maltooligosaccharide transport system substrate-binding protein